MANPPLWQLPDPPASSPAGRVPSFMRPAAIRRAVLFMYAGAALSVAYGVVEGITAHTSPTNRAAYNAGEVMGGTIVGLLQCALWLWMAAKNGTGRGWARILSSVFFGICCLDLIGSLAVLALGKADASSVAGFIVVLAEGVVGLIALILLWQHESSAYFAARSQAKETAAAYRAYPATSPFSHGQSGYGQPAQYGQPPLYGQPGFAEPSQGGQPPLYGQPGFAEPSQGGQPPLYGQPGFAEPLQGGQPPQHGQPPQYTPPPPYLPPPQ